MQEKFGHFRRLLDNNNQALEIMADMEEKLSGDYVFDSSYISTQVHDLGEQVSGMVTALNLLTNNRYQTDLVPICQRLQEEMLAELEAVPTIPDTPFILPLSALHRELAPAVGGKMANLGEIGNRVGLPVPQGFAITAAAYKRFLESSSLAADLEARLSQANIEDLDSLKTISQELQAMVRQAPLPPDLEEAIVQAGQDLPTHWLAVRSSAVGEDTEFSFAGQFATLLERRRRLLTRALQGDRGQQVYLPGHILLEIPAVFRQRAPHGRGRPGHGPGPGQRRHVFPGPPRPPGRHRDDFGGLGPGPVRGGRHRLPGPLHGEPRRTPTPSPSGGWPKNPWPSPAARLGEWRRSPWPPKQAQAPCLTDDQVRTLAEIALELEDHFGQPPGYRVDRGGGGQHHHPPIPAPADQRPGLCRRGAAPRPRTHGGPHPPPRHPGGGGRGRRPGPPLPPR